MKLINTDLFDEITDKAIASERLRMNYNFHDSSEAPSQRMLNALEPGTKIPIHKHDHTAENYIVLKGSIRIEFYDSEKHLIECAIIDPKEGIYGIDIPAGQLHTLISLQRGTIIFECKDGPYVPAIT